MTKIYVTFDTLTGSYDTVAPFDLPSGIYVVEKMHDYQELVAAEIFRTQVMELVGQDGLRDKIMELIVVEQERRLREGSGL